MNNTILVEVTNKKAMELLLQLENLNLIKLLKIDNSEEKQKLSDKYRGAFSIDDAKNFNKYTEKVRKEWDNI